MSKDVAVRYQNTTPVSTHVAFCEMLQRLSANPTSWLAKDLVDERSRHCRAQTAPLRNASQKPFPTAATEREAAPLRRLPGRTPSTSGETVAECEELKSFYFQVGKETVTAFAGRLLYQNLLRCHHEEATAEQTKGVAPGSFSTSDRQSMLRQGMRTFLETVARQESDLRKLAATCQAHQRHCSTKLLPEVKKFSALPQVPLQKWAGAHRYNNWFVKVAAPSFDEDGRQSRTTTIDKRAINARVPRASLTAAVAPSATALPKLLVMPSDVEAELLKYWKLHEEAAARSRLEALRSHDAEAFAAHVSLLKVSALLEIMEKTEGFMRRIGMRLESQAVGTPHPHATPSDKDGATRTLHAAAPAGRRGDSDYARFRAYVASTKTEFKLIHRIDTFVPSQPTELQATLLPHQMDGLRFLASLHANHINGILADEMGVGKTIQTLAFLLYLKEKRRAADAAMVLRGADAQTDVRRPHLVLAPLSVIREWREACEQFVAPSFRVGVFQELDDAAHDAPAYDLILMPVHAVRYAGAEAVRVQWDYIVVDEAHKAMANLKTVTAQAILALPCARRLVLTGTPLSSDLQELWSLLHFLNPSVFSDNDAFEEVFRRPFQVYEASEMELTEEERGLLVLRLHQVLRPFLLRRTKADVDASLRITFHRVLCPLSTMQQRLLGLLRQQRRTPAVLQARLGSDAEDEEPDSDAADNPSVAGLSAAACDGATPAAYPYPQQSVCIMTELSKLVTRYLPNLAAVNTSETKRNSVQADKGLGLSSANISECAAQQVCNHAFLLPFFPEVLQRHGFDDATREGFPDADIHSGAAIMTLACSGKFIVLHLLLSRLFVAGCKLVLFTHWLSCVDLIVDYLHSRGWMQHMEVLTGGSSEAERKASVRRFQNDPTCLFFVLSIKAGGCGINLQAAHVVVLLDRDYTATNEDQALARVYRIGQRHTVRALYFSTDDVSEHRVTRRAQDKNRPRQAIIDGGVYQVTEPVETTAATTEDSNTSVLVSDGVNENTAHDIHTARLWSCASAARCSENGACLTEIPSRAGMNSTGVACVSPTREFWTALRQLVSAFDDLILTDDERMENSDVATMEGVENVPAAPCSSPSSADGSASVMRRLRYTLPPESVEELERQVERHDAAQSSTFSSSTQLPPSSPSAHSAAALAQHEELDDAGSCRKNVTHPTEKTVDDESEAGCALPHVAAAVPTTVKTPTDPLRHPALFWLEFAYLLHLACEGPTILSAALKTAERNDDQRDDPVAQLKRRQRRDRRAAKRIRLATVDVPDAFREQCWEDGLEDETEIAARYVDRLDARAGGKKKKCTTTTA
ncbi:hypothetical protein ABB37_02846 [Leptomonas pyrrhocoris]|uniref:Helicase-like protein n=1 Tax=Leptomonas pyrrhocoris TaxID=157538 RepID=A0A0M9G5X4_LEPPY|nr:hypothetical protein ABB37_02846 [Leptomonas pyrrhocoris]KPA83150.1 hypothetical protein ABB37_02846 [Leptomonas pyrrhocoris]|eukprot:XP_015661589.1 hypothetical protein ABB37_02846 [Leptomonas pyrrhocoris]